MVALLKGEGEPSPEGGPAGDCQCVVHVRPHSIFQREGKHLHLRLPISYCQAALGASIEIPTLKGSDTLEIPAGTGSRELFRKAGCGMPDVHGGRVGDLIVQTYIEVPKKLGKDQRRLLEELAELEHAHVTPHRKSFLEKVLDWRGK
jgi:molecular chaperone DnaJ